MGAPNPSVRAFPTIKAVRTFVTQGVGSGGDYHNVAGGHWLIDSKISTPMSGYEAFRTSRTSWGINVLGSFCVELEASDGTRGFATGFGGPPACWLVKEHFERFLIGAGKHSLLPEPQFSPFPNCSSPLSRASCSESSSFVPLPKDSARLARPADWL